MILEILAVAAGVAAGSVLGAWLRRRKKQQPAAADPAVEKPKEKEKKKEKPREAKAKPRGESDVRIGDAVMHLGEDYLVVSESRFEEEAPIFVVWTLESEGRTRHLLRDEGANAKTIWMQPIEPLVGGKPPDRVRHEDVEYRLSARGRARVASEGDDTLPSGEVEWIRLAGPSRHRMLVLVAGGRTDWLIGEETLPGMVEVLPGS